VSTVLEDLTQLSPKRLERRLEELAREALPCSSVVVFDGSPSEGLTVGLQVESLDRRDVLDLARVLDVEPNGYVFSAWALLSPNPAIRTGGSCSGSSSSAQSSARSASGSTSAST
jgi:hypothetical protein